MGFYGGGKLDVSAALTTFSETAFAKLTVDRDSTIEFTMGFVIAGSPYVPRFLELISGGKKQSAPVYPSYQVSNYAPQKLHSMDQPPSTSWIALRDQDGVSQVGLANSQYMPR